MERKKGGGGLFPPPNPASTARRNEDARCVADRRNGASYTHARPAATCARRIRAFRSPRTCARSRSLQLFAQAALALADASPRRGGVVWWSRVSGWRSTRRWRVLRPCHSDTARAKALGSPRSRYVTAALAASLQAITAQRGDALLFPPYRATRRSGGTRWFCRFALGVRASHILMLRPPYECAAESDTRRESGPYLPPSRMRLFGTHPPPSAPCRATCGLRQAFSSLLRAHAGTERDH